MKRVPKAKRVYVDESGINGPCPRENGRAPRGQKVEDVRSGKRSERTNVVAALCQEEHYAVRCYDCSTNAALFEEWFENVLLPSLPHGQGYTIILDNASHHRKEALRKLARGKVRMLFLPPYSPDYNRIEKSWANMKRWLRDNLRDFFMVDLAVYEYFALRNLA